MRILFLAWNFPPKVGGMEAIVFSIFKRLEKRHNIIALAPFSDKCNESSRIIRCPFKNFLSFNLWIIYKGISLLRKEKIDIIFSASFLTSPVSITLARLFHKKVISQVYGLDVIYPNFLYQIVCSFFLPLNDLIISISKKTADELLSRGVRQEKLKIINPGIDTRQFESKISTEQLKRKYELSGKKVILTVSRLAKRKGIVEFINNSLPTIVGEIPNVMYIVVGSNPTQSMSHKEDIMLKIKQAIKKNRLEAHVRLWGGVDPYQDRATLFEAYNLCDIFVLPVIAVKGDMEGFGIVFLEANAAGKVTVGTKIGGIPDAIEHAKSGFLVEVGNYTQLNDTIISLLKDDSTREKLGNYAKGLVRTKFDWDVVIENYSKAFKGLMLDSHSIWSDSYLNTRRNESVRRGRIQLLGLDSFKDKALLEVGCGDGLNLKIFKELGFSDLYALDNSKQLIERIDFISKERLFLRDVYSTKFKDKSFDIVFIDSLLHHLERPKVALTEIKRILKVGGLLCIMEPRPSLIRKLLDLLTFSPFNILSKRLKYRRRTMEEEYGLHMAWLKDYKNIIKWLETIGFEKLLFKKTTIGIILKYKK